MTSETREAIERNLASPNEDTRWQAAIRLGDHIGEAPDVVWSIVGTWGCSDDEDTSMAIATCVLEHLLEHHFETVFPKAEALAHQDPRFASTILSVWRFGQSESPANAERLDALHQALREKGRRGPTKG